MPTIALGDIVGRAIKNVQDTGICALGAPRERDRWIFLYGFAKNERDNIDQKEERDLKRIAGVLLEMNWTALGQLLEAGQLLEVKDG